MKTCKFIIFLFLIITCTKLYGESSYILIGTFKWQCYDGIWQKYTDRYGGILYNEERQLYRLYLEFDDSVYSFWVMDKGEIATFRKAIQKYLDWAAMASRDGDEIDKEISQSGLLDVYFDYFSSGPYLSKGRIKYSFYSRSPTRHQLILSTSELTDINNEYITLDSVEAHLDLDDVKGLQNLLDIQTLKSKLKEFHEQKKYIDKKYQ